MANIVDVSPTKSNTTIPNNWQSVVGRMLALGSSPDGQLVFAGSYSNLWRSTDGGQTFSQVTWPQPAEGQFGVPGSVGGWCVVDIAVGTGWDVNKHPRFVADITGGGLADIVGFGEDGVWTALGNGDGSFQPARVVLPAFTINTGGWQVAKHPRFLADLTGKGRADIVGFGDDGVWTALSNGDGTFQPAKFVIADLGFNQGWRIERHPRFLADLTGDGRADIIGFGDAGVWTALSNGDGTFQPPRLVIGDLGFTAGGWRVESHPRFVADITGDGRADIVGFGNAGVFTALSNGDGTFQAPKFVITDLGFNSGWRVEKHPRMLADLSGRRRVDIVGFGDAGVWTAMSNGDGTFQPPKFVIADLGFNSAWRVERHPRFAADLTGDGRADLIGFGDAGVWTAVGNGDGTFQPPKFVIADLGFTGGGWRVEKHPRFVARLTANTRSDIVGFGDAGVWTALSKGDGTFQPPAFVMANFGFQFIVMAMTRNDRENKDSGIWRSSDSGGTWSRVHQFPYTASSGAAPPAGQLVWGAGNDHMVYAAGGSALAVSRDAGATFQNVMAMPGGRFQSVNHVAVGTTPDGALLPPVVYALGDNIIFTSLDGGTTWVQDKGTLPPTIGGQVSSANSRCPSVMVVSPRSPLEVFLVSNDRILWRGDYSSILGGPKSTWEQVPPPNMGGQDSGNIFVMASLPRHGNLLFFGPQRSQAWVGPLDPQSASDWVTLDQGNVVHVDLHGLFLSGDFEATFANGEYKPGKGTVWMISDGGVYRSTDGGKHFTAAQNIQSLSVVNIAGVALPGKGPALSLNSGDNDGFYSMDGGANWKTQDYGGFDNDCTYSDPLRPHSMLVFTPRWDKHNHNVAAKLGNTVTVYETSPGNLPDIRVGTSHAHTVPGPPLSDGSPIWNVSSFFGMRGSRPIVLNMPGDDPAAPGDYVFVRLRAGAPSVVVRTRDVLNITDRAEWDANSGRVTQQGPALPVADAAVLQASGGHSATVFYVGGDASNRLWKWTAGMAAWQQLVPGGGANVARRFFVNPYNPGLIYIIDSQDVKRSDDGGITWQIDTSLQAQLTGGGRIPVARGEVSGEGDHVDFVITDMQFDPNRPGVRFAVGEGGAFFSNDGAKWGCLLDSGALPGRPANCYYDWISNPSNRALYVGFAGRSIVRISPLPTGSTGPGTAKVEVPDVMELGRPQAARQIESAGLVPKFVGPAANSQVIKQVPAAGKLVAAGSTVTMTLRRGIPQ